MNFSRISESTLIGKALRYPLRFIPREMSMPIWQGRLKGKRWIVGAMEHGCWLGSFEYDKQRLLEKTITPGSIVFDLGAQAGFYTLLSSVLVGPQGKVFAFEPLPPNLVYLKKHLRLNNITNVTIIEAAVSDAPGIAAFEEGARSTQGHISPHGGLQVKTVSLDDLTSSGKIPYPDFMKVDVEGAEVQVLDGAASLLRRGHPTIFLETHGPDLHRQCSEFLQSLGYRLEPLSGKLRNNNSGSGINEIVAYHRG